MKIQLSESKFRNILTEMVREILTEAKWGKNRQNARRYVENLVKSDKQLYDTVKRMLYNHVGEDNIIEQSNGEVFVLTNNDEIPLESWFFFQLINEMNLGHNKNGVINDCKYDLGLCKLYMNELLVKRNQEINNQITPIINFLRNTPHFLDAVQENNPDFNYNNITLQQLQELTAEPMKKLRSSNKEKYQGLGVNNVRQDYDIYRLENTEHAQNFQLKDGRVIDLRQYTDWCITNRQGNYNAYAGGFGIFYVCLQHGFEQIPAECGDNCPLDSYGLSMLAICVTVEGDIKNVTCRWNHANGGNDNIMSLDELSTYFHGDPHQLFPPRSKEELIKMGYYPLEDVIEDVKRGYYSRLYLVKEFNNGGVYIVRCGKYVIVTNNQVCNNQWFDWVGGFDSNGIAKVVLNGKWNWFSLEKQGLLFPNQWFDEIDDYENGIAKVKLNGKWNWFDFEKQDYLFPNLWFDWVGGFDSNGIAKVKLKGKWTWFSLEKQGLLSPNLWFDDVSKFENGIAEVKLKGKRNWFSLEKQDYLFPNLWFDYVNDFDSNGIAKVELNGYYYYVTEDGELLDYFTKELLSQEQVQKLFQQQQQIAEMVNRLVRNYRRY